MPTIPVVLEESSQQCCQPTREISYLYDAMHGRYDGQHTCKLIKLVILDPADLAEQRVSIARSPLPQLEYTEDWPCRRRRVGDSCLLHHRALPEPCA